MKSLVLLFTIIFTLVCNSAFAESTNTQSPQPSSDYIRVLRDDKGDFISLDTSIVRFKAPNGVTVDLVSAVHIAEKHYYEELNKKFSEYDAVLYELVAKAEDEEQFKNQSTNHKQSKSELSNLQTGFSDILKLDFQLNEINYSAPNFVHADYSPEELLDSMKQRGESFISLVSKILLASMASSQSAEGQAANLEMMMIMFEQNEMQRAIRLRRVVAHEFQTVEDFIQVINSDSGSSLISGRNDKALKVLREQMQKGKKKFAIFYGGAHMSDLAEKLIKDFSLSKKNVTWLTAWNLRTLP